MASNGFFSSQRNTQHRNANAGTTLKRRNENRGYNGIGGFQEERNRYAPPQKRFRSQPQTQTQFRSDMNLLPLYHHQYHHHGISNNNMSRVSQSYNADVITSNSSFVLPNTNYHGNYENPNPQVVVPIPLPYRKLDDVSFDSLPEWTPNQALISNFALPNANAQASLAFTNVSNSLPNMVSIGSQAMSQQPIVLSQEITDLLSILNNEKEKETSEASNSFKLPLGLSFDDPSSLKIRHESVINSLYSGMPRQCSSCGVRFKSQKDHSNHMDWHVRKNRSLKTNTRQRQKPNKSRDWFASTPLWLIAATAGAVESGKPYFGEVQKKEEHQEEEHVVPADEDQKLCALCEERFEDFFSHEADDWMYKDAVYLTKNGPIVHVKCMPESRVEKDSIKPRVMSASVPSVTSYIVR